MERLPLLKFITARITLFGCALLAVFVWLIYGQVIHFEFLDYDDPHYVFDNPMVNQGFSFPGFFWALSTSYYDFWHPLTWWSHMLDCQLFGLQPGMHHLVNAGFHLANTLLVFAILARLTGAWVRALVVALLFALHPMHVESVAWVAERKDVLSTFCLLLSLGGYLEYAQATPGSQLRSRCYIFSLVAFALGLMAKAMIVTLPFVFILFDFWPLARLTAKTWNLAQLKSLVLEKCPFFALSLASALVTYLTMKTTGNIEAAENVPLSLRLANVPVSYATYLSKLVYPHNLTAFYPMQNTLPAGQVIGSLLGLLAITFLVFRCLATRPYLMFGWLFFLGTLVPVIGIVANGLHAVADRYTYVPFLGLFIAATWLVADWAKNRFGQVLLAGLALLTFGLLIPACYHQVSLWKNSGTLWSDSLTKTTNNPVACNNLGYYYWQNGQTNLAISYYRKSLSIKPDSFAANVNLGAGLYDGGNPKEATNYLLRALQVVPDVPYVYLDLSLAEMQLHDYPAAVVTLTKYVELSPNQATPLLFLGEAYSGLNQSSNAIDYYQRALRLEPANVLALFHLGDEWLKVSNYDAAISALNQTVFYRSNWDEAYFKLALAFMGRGDVKPAVQAYQQLIVANPFHLSGLNNLAWIQATSPDATVRNGSQAVEFARRACEQTTFTNADYVKTLAAAYAEAGQMKAAVETAQKACDVATLAGQITALETNKMLLNQFKSGRPYRDAALDPKN